MDFQLTYRPFSQRSILVEWPQKIDKKVHDDVLLFKNHLLKLDIKPIIYINFGYCSILIVYDSTIDKINDTILMLKEQYSCRVSTKKCDLRHWKIPVCYHDKFALDLEEISKKSKLSKSEIIGLHSKIKYTVYFIGFLPGFLYLGGLDERLNFPRKESPRTQIKMGAVAIGGSQTGIYPNVSPGGWNIIGNSPLEFFNSKKDNPCFARPGDKIEFVPIDLEDYSIIQAQVVANTYQIENKIIDG